MSISDFTTLDSLFDSATPIAENLVETKLNNTKFQCSICKKYFHNVTHNDPIFDGWDADILLHDHKIAICWNGDWHYKNMEFTK